jgi:hypothetical protein
MPKLKNWGGARPGSGRPIVGKEKRQITTIALEPVLLAALERYAKQAGLSRNEAVNRLLSERLLIDPPSVQKPLIDKQNDNKGILPDWFTSDKPLLVEVLEYKPAKFGQWFTESLIPMPTDKQEQLKDAWRDADKQIFNRLQEYGQELIGAIRAGKADLDPALVSNLINMDDSTCREYLIAWAGIKL